VLILLVATLAMTAFAANTCQYVYSDITVSPPKNYTYNLDRMTRTSNFYTGWENPDRGYTYIMNPCNWVTNVTQCSTGTATVCQVNSGTGAFVATVASWQKSPDASWGIINAASPSNGAKQTFTNGDICWIFGQQRIRTAILTFNCGSSVQNTFTVTEDDNTCTFTIQISSPYACAGGSSGGGGGGGGDGGLSGGSIFLIMLVCIVPVYILVGCIYKTKVNGTSGIESCPNVEFWRDLPHLVKDGAMYAFSGCKKGSDSHYDEL